MSLVAAPVGALAIDPRLGKLFVVATAASALIGVVAGYTVGLWLLTGLGFLAAGLGLWRPPIGLLGISLLCTIDPPMRIFLMRGGLLRWNTLNYWLLLVALLALPWLLRVRSAQVKALVGFVALLAIWLVPSPDVPAGIQHLVNIACVFGLFAYFLLGGRSDRTWRLMAWSSGLAGCLGGLGYFLHAATLPYANPNAWAIFPLTAILVIALGFVHTHGSRDQVLLAMMAAVNLVWIFLSGSRGGMLSGLATCGFLVVAAPGLNRRAMILALAACALLAVSVHFGDLQAKALHRVSRLLEGSSTLSERTSGRADLMLGGWYIFLDHPMGVGTGGFEVAWSELGPREGLSSFKQGERFPAHAGWVKTLAENGVVGVFFQAWLVLSFALGGLFARRRDLFLVGLLTSATLALGWVTTEFQAKGLWWLLAAASSLFILARHGLPRRERSG